MAKLTRDDRKSMDKGKFGIPERAPDQGSYPMPDEEHARVAIGMAKMHGGPVGRIKDKAKKLFGVGNKGKAGKVPKGRRGNSLRRDEEHDN